MLTEAAALQLYLFYCCCLSKGAYIESNFPLKGPNCLQEIVTDVAGRWLASSFAAGSRDWKDFICRRGEGITRGAAHIKRCVLKNEEKSAKSPPLGRMKVAAVCNWKGGDSVKCKEVEENVWFGCAWCRFFQTAPNRKQDLSFPCMLCSFLRPRLICSRGLCPTFVQIWVKCQRKSSKLEKEINLLSLLNFHVYLCQWPSLRPQQLLLIAQILTL